MPARQLRGWEILLDGYPWFSQPGQFPLPAYSEFMPPPRLGRRPYDAAADELLYSKDDPYGWNISEIEEEYELQPGLETITRQLMSQVVELGRGQPARHIGGYQGRNLKDNPYWPEELGRCAGHLDHERYVTLLPLALSRTQDDSGRVRWTLFGSSEQGPERAFWKSFYRAPGEELPEKESIALLARLLQAAYGDKLSTGAELKQAGLRILPTSKIDATGGGLPSWTNGFVLDEKSSLDDVHYLLTFLPFGELPAELRQKYLAGQLHLIPFPGSLVFWGMPVYARLQSQLPFALQAPLLRLIARNGGPEGIRVPQSGWLREPRRDEKASEIQEELLLNTYRRTSRNDRVHRYEDKVAASKRVDKMTQVLFGTALDTMGLYDKPMARNVQIWNEDAELLLDGPRAARQEIQKAADAILGGGNFRYRFQFPAMRVGFYEVYWQRPLVAYLSHQTGQVERLEDAPLGYLTAYRADKPDLAAPVELFPRLLRRDLYLSALKHFDNKHDYYAHQTPLNILELLNSHAMLGGRPLPRTFARRLLQIAKEETLEEWLSSLPERAGVPAQGARMKKALEDILGDDPALPAPLTFHATATAVYEQAYWQDLLTLSHGRYTYKDNADLAQDPATQSAAEHAHRDLEALGDYLIGRHRQAIALAGMQGTALVGDTPFRWQTDFDFAGFGGWKINQQGKPRERNILVVIPGKRRDQAVVLADYYATAYMEDVFEKARGGTGARLAARGADDNHSATAVLLQAAPIFLELARAGKLERDVWLLHLTGEEFPSDCLGARHFSQALVENTLSLRVDQDQTVDLSGIRVVGVFVMDMIAHNREDAQDIFQIAPGAGADALRLAYHAHIANTLWNEKTKEWNESEERRGRGRSQRTKDGFTIPPLARHLAVRGEVRTEEDPRSSLYNTDGQVFSDAGVPAVLFMENYDIDRQGYHDQHDTMENIDLDYGAAVSAIAIETVARVATEVNR